MADFKLSLQKTLAHEGGYVHDPIDAGGETYKGISRKAHPNWKGWNCIDNYKTQPDFPKTLDENIELQNQIEQFYLKNFWKRLKADKIEKQRIADSIFDFAINAGIKTSVRLAQTIINAETDGIIGPKTLEKLNNFDPQHFLSAFTLAKISHYLAIVKKRPANQKFLNGWFTRALEYQ